MKCKTCKHWHYELRHEENRFRYGECNLEPRSYSDMLSHHMLGTEDEPVIVGEEFGCVNWGPMESSNDR